MEALLELVIHQVKIKQENLTEKEIEKNIKNIEKNFKKISKSDNPKTKPSFFVNNYLWLKELNYIAFLREIGKHFTINKMLTFESVKIDWIENSL